MMPRTAIRARTRTAIRSSDSRMFSWIPALRPTAFSNHRVRPLTAQGSRDWVDALSPLPVLLLEQRVPAPLDRLRRAEADGQREGHPQRAERDEEPAQHDLPRELQLPERQRRHDGEQRALKGARQQPRVGELL